MRQAFILSGSLAAGLALVACSVPAGSPGSPAPKTLFPDPAAARPTGQLLVRVAWPREVQTIPYSTNLIDVTVADSLGNTLATAAISQSTGQTTSQETLTVPAGDISVGAKGFAGSTLVGQGSATGSVTVNREAQVALSLNPVYVPTVSSFPPNAGPGALIDITGADFGESRHVPLSVTFGGVSSPEAWAVDDNDIEAMVPSGFASGSVVVTADGVPSTPSPGTFCLLSGLSGLSTPSATLSVNQQLNLSLTASDAAGPVSDPYVTWRVLAGSNVSAMASGSFSSATGSQTVFTALATGSGVLAAESGSLMATASLVVQ